MAQSQMELEARSAPAVLEKQFAENLYVIQNLCTRLQCYPPPFAVTVARGSSDHAATFAKYLFETQLGLPTASAAPSVTTLYGAKLQLNKSLVIALSQSGASPDVAETLAAARSAGAVTVAFVNQHPSPLSQVAEYVIPLHAGPEISVAATKSYLAMLGALVQFTALMTQQPALMAALSALPSTLQTAVAMDWTPAILTYEQQQNTYVIARGFGFPIAQEAALKFKETARIHAEAFSGAEVMHGPVALVQEHFPILLFGQQDVTLPGILDLGKRVKQLGGNVLLAVPSHHSNQRLLNDAASCVLEMPPSLHPVCDPLLVIQAFYSMMARLAIARGLNPDAPIHLSKVTKTW
jgi:glucosamine--fructose-6-phosphate aminotransferase (isomerizing)